MRCKMQIVTILSSLYVVSYVNTANVTNATRACDLYGDHAVPSQYDATDATRHTNYFVFCRVCRTHVGHGVSERHDYFELHFYGINYKLLFNTVAVIDVLCNFLLLSVLSQV